MYQGSCLCGAVQYELRGDLGDIVFCHCSQCRKAQGSAFASNSPVQAADLLWLAGQEMLSEYESSPGKHRAFCSRCGSPLYSRRDNLPEVLRLRIGTLDTPIAVKPSGHIYAPSHAEWFTIADELPQYETLP